MVTLAKAKEFLLTIKDTIKEGFRSEEQYKRCLELCLSCEKLKTKKGKNYCGVCECGGWKAAEVENKQWLRARCPLGKFDAAGNLFKVEMIKGMAVDPDTVQVTPNFLPADVRRRCFPDLPQGKECTRREAIEAIQKTGGRAYAKYASKG